MLVFLLVCLLVAPSGGDESICQAEERREEQLLDLEYSQMDKHVEAGILDFTVVKGGSSKSMLHQCVDICCHLDGCNVAALDKSDKKCYLVMCIPLNQCKWMHEKDTMSVVVNKPAEEGKLHNQKHLEDLLKQDFQDSQEEWDELYHYDESYMADDIDEEQVIIREPTATKEKEVWTSLSREDENDDVTPETTDEPVEDEVLLSGPYAGQTIQSADQLTLEETNEVPSEGSKEAEIEKEEEHDDSKHGKNEYGENAMIDDEEEGDEDKKDKEESNQSKEQQERIEKEEKTSKTKEEQETMQDEEKVEKQQTAENNKEYNVAKGENEVDESKEDEIEKEGSGDEDNVSTTMINFFTTEDITSDATSLITGNTDTTSLITGTTESLISDKTDSVTEQPSTLETDESTVTTQTSTMETTLSPTGTDSTSVTTMETVEESTYSTESLQDFNNISTSGQQLFGSYYYASSSRSAVGGLITATILGVLFSFAILAVFGRKLYDTIQRQNYRQMDYLVDGMYH